MAKKNSSKTATEKAISSSEPRVLSFKGWQGVNFADAPLTWDPLETGQGKFRQTDLPANFLMVQNNLITTDTLGLETRQDSVQLGTKPNGYKLTGVAAIFRKWLFVVGHGTFFLSGGGDLPTWSYVERDKIFYRDITGNNSWTEIYTKIGESVDTGGYAITELGFFEGNLVATCRSDDNTNGLLLLAKVTVQNEGTSNESLLVQGTDWYGGTTGLTNYIVDTPKIGVRATDNDPDQDRPGVSPAVTAGGSISVSSSSSTTNTEMIQIKFCYTNRLGSTLCQDETVSESNPGTRPHIKTVWTDTNPSNMTGAKYLIIGPSGGDNIDGLESVEGVDIYARDNENTDWVFAGHVNVGKTEVTNGTWSYNWYGNMTDITQWLTAQLMVPTENTTHGVDASHFACHDSRMYFWGMPSKPYRLWIGGNPGAEFSTARGLGGGWIDIEPGSGYDVQGTEKWKTVQGANIVTVMTGNRNTTKIKRFNVVETNLTMTNEIQYKSYMYEEVSNVVGCNSRWGHGVFADGLYSLNRYGLMLTTMAMEYNSQMKNQSVSDAIAPIFTDRIGKRISDGRIVCINDVIYVVLSEEGTQPSDPIGLDNVILCYDIGKKAWYTWTHDETLTSPDTDKVLHVFAIDSDEYMEGLGVVTENEVRLYPVTGPQSATVPDFQVLLETGELIPRMPMQAFWYIQQLEFRFDYFVGNPDDPATILIEGVDYYGRQFVIEKKLNVKSRGNHGATGEQRNYVEWIRVDKLVESLRIRIKGKARFRLTHINCKAYQQADTIGTPYGFDAKDTYYNRKGQQHVIHHYIDDYDNLRRAIVT